MSNGLMDLQSQLRALEDNVEHALRTLLRTVESNCLFADPPRVLYQLQFIDQLIAFVLPLPTERIRIRSLLDLSPSERVGYIASTRRIFRLMNLCSLGREEPLLFASKVQVRFCERDTGNGAQLGVNLLQQRQEIGRASCRERV